MVHPALKDLTIESFRTRADWLASRAAPDVIGASEAAMALGVSPYGTAWSLWESKRPERQPKRGPQLARGHRWEPAVVAEYADESGYTTLTPAEACGRPLGSIIVLAHPEAPWLRESPDAFAVDPHTGELGHVEAKTAMRAHEWAPEQGVVIERWEDSHTELVPAHYAIQGYVQLAVTRLPWVDLCALVPHRGWLGVRWVRLMSDVDTQGAIVETLSAWRERHLVAGDPPPVDGSAACNRYLARRFPAGKRKPERIATDDELDLMRRLYEARQAEKCAKRAGDRLRNLLIERAEGYRLRVPGCGKSAPYGQPQGSAGRQLVDLDAIRAEAPELVEKHTRTGAPASSFNLYRFDQLEEHDDVG